AGHSVGQVYLVDFDSVKTGATRSDQTMTIVGTYGYMPPEQFSGQAKPASDLYSLGATLIYAAIGKHPADLPQKSMRIEFEPHVSLSSNLVAWLKWMTDPNIDRRPSSVSQAIQRLRESDLETGLSLTKPLKQPSGSKIRVRRTPKTLEIVLPNHVKLSDYLYLAVMTGFMSLLTSGIWVATTFAEDNDQPLIFLLLMVLMFPTLIAAICSIVNLINKSIAFVVDSSTKLLIEPNSITETDYFGQIKRYKISQARVKVVCDRKISFVELRVSGHTFNLPTSNQAEREWLVYTLRQKLQVPIIYAE
ncbi:MAG: hypothetical protein F6K11_37370, partial [Leptolyngbya sp. SIO3F4]|nr:hypothetical protein [Leptolyngbya sp. SIO3F4]